MERYCTGCRTNIRLKPSLHKETIQAILRETGGPMVTAAACAQVFSLFCAALLTSDSTHIQLGCAHGSPQKQTPLWGKPERGVFIEQVLGTQWGAGILSDI